MILSPTNLRVRDLTCRCRGSNRVLIIKGMKLGARMKMQPSWTKDVILGKMLIHWPNLINLQWRLRTHRNLGVRKAQKGNFVKLLWQLQFKTLKRGCLPNHSFLRTIFKLANSKSKSLIASTDQGDHRWTREAFPIKIRTRQKYFTNNRLHRCLLITTRTRTKL